MGSLSIWIREQFSRHASVQVSTIVEVRDRQELLCIVYRLGAAITVADGVIDRAEIATAEQIGALLFEDFDSQKFRATFSTDCDIRSVKKEIDVAITALNDRDKKLVFSYLCRIANSDGELAPSENELLSYIEKKWQIGSRAIWASS